MVSRLVRDFLGGLGRLSGVVCALLIAGCNSPAVEFRANLPYIRAQEQRSAPLTAAQLADLQAVLTRQFGTPDEPRVPDWTEHDLRGVLPLERLLLAAGAVSSDERGTPRGLYRQHCASCHGISGEGVGPTASLLNPYPRDFRRGLFKFKTTPSNERPRHEDLKRILREGIPGTGMPSYRLLPDEQLDALADYVRYLSVRGEVERNLVFELAYELEEGDRLLDASLADTDPAGYDQQRSLIQEAMDRVLAKWLQCEQLATPVPPRPVPWDLNASVARGRELFLGKVASCVSCHGPRGRGDGQTNDYDEWTKEVMDPTKPDQVRRHLLSGGFAPQHILPRNLRLGVFRGGRRPEDLYRRIHNGIAGTPMPSAPLQPADGAVTDSRLRPEDIWHLVDFVYSLSGTTAAPQEPSGK